MNPTCEGCIYLERKAMSTDGVGYYFCCHESMCTKLGDAQTIPKRHIACQGNNFYESEQTFAQPYYEKKYDQGKLRYDLIPPEILEALAEVYTYGLNKGYGEESWKDVPDAKKRYTAAFFRHFQDYRKGNTIDPESTKSHLWHALWNIGTLVWFEMQESKTNKS